MAGSPPRAAQSTCPLRHTHAMVPQQPQHPQQPLPRQLDIFAHSRDVMLRNDVLHALERRDAAGARAAWRVLAVEFPTDPDLAPLDLLARTLAAPCDTPLPDHDALARERHRLMDDVAVAARRALGTAGAEPWLRPLWHALAARCWRPYRPCYAALTAPRSAPQAARWKPRSRQCGAPYWHAKRSTSRPISLTSVVTRSRSPRSTPNCNAVSRAPSRSSIISALRRSQASLNTCVALLLARRHLWLWARNGANVSARDVPTYRHCVRVAVRTAVSVLGDPRRSGGHVGGRRQRRDSRAI